MVNTLLKSKHKGFIFTSLLILVTDVISHVYIVSPQKLRDKFREITKRDELYSNFANYGSIPYGFTSIGKVYWDFDNKVNQLGCNDLSYNIFSKNTVEAPIIMVDRGNCTFTNKTYNVEKAGGEVALVVNTIDDTDPRHIWMARDQTVKNVHIPTVMISRSDGNIIKDYMKETKEDVMLSIKFEMKVSVNSTEKMDIFLTSAEPKIYQFFINFRKYYEELGNSLDMIPHYVTMSYTWARSKQNEPVENCLSHGLYCSNPYLNLNITDGRDVLFENIRQKCVYNQAYYEGDKKKSLYLDYMEAFFTLCMNPIAPDFTRSCSLRSMEKAGVDIKSVDKCFAISFGSSNKLDSAVLKYIEDGVDNTILKEESKYPMNSFVFFPAIHINKQNFLGTWSARNVLEAVCTGSKIIPKACYDENIFVKIEQEKASTNILLIIAIIVVVIVIKIVVYILCRKYMKKRTEESLITNDFDNKVNDVVSKYFKMKDNDTATNRA